MRVGRLVVASLQLGVCAGASDDVTSVDLSRQKGTAGPARRPASAGRSTFVERLSEDFHREQALAAIEGGSSCYFTQGRDCPYVLLGSAGACLGWRSSCVRGSGGLAR
jgi:hypothetical protein